MGSKYIQFLYNIFYKSIIADFNLIGHRNKKKKIPLNLFIFLLSSVFEFKKSTLRGAFYKKYQSLINIPVIF